MYDSPEYKRTRASYIAECTFEYFVALMVSDSILSLLLGNLGMSDSSIGIVSSLVSLAFLFQLLTVPVVRRITNTKVFGIIFHTIGQFAFAALFLVPLLPVGGRVGRATAVALIVVAYFGNYFVNAIIFRWGTSFVEPSRRGKYGAVRDMTSLISGVGIQIAAGIAIDRYTEAGNVRAAFIFCAVSCCVFSAADLCSLLLMEKEKTTFDGPGQTAARATFADIMRNTLGKKEYRSTVVLESLWRCAMYSAAGFVGTFKLNELAMTVTAIEIVNIAAQMARMALSLPFGRLSDRTSYSKSASVGFAVAAAGFLALAFTTPDTRFMVVVFTVCYNVSMAGTHSNFLYMTYSYTDPRFITEALAIKKGLSGIAGFLMSLHAGRILSVVQENGNSLFGISVYGQQVLGVLAFLMTVACIAYNSLVIGRQRDLEKPADGKGGAKGSD